MRVEYEPTPQTVDRLRADDVDEAANTPSNSPSIHSEDSSANSPPDR